jgi:dihydrofolate synthase/folylpolyglutamate synthase
MMPELAVLLEQIGVENTKFYGEGRLEHLKKIAEQANLLTWRQPIISVTGTNGKGSTVAALSSIYQHAGYRCGVFTSPHLQRVNERIAINQDIINDDDLFQALQAIRGIVGGCDLSFFEAMTLAALYYFQQNQVDVLILEVGLGGRLDAINILDADLVVMSSIALDHQSILGSSIDAIAKEKAGLLRPHGSLVFADSECPQSIIQIAQELELKFYRLGQDYKISLDTNIWEIKTEFSDFSFQSMPKIHIQAMAAAIMSVICLKDILPYSIKALQMANQKANIPARLERIDGRPSIILDVAHNPHAVERLYNYLSKQDISGKIHLVFSVLRDKDGDKIVEIINKLSPLWYNCLLPSERSHTEESLGRIFKHMGQQPFFSMHAIDAFEHARSHADEDDLIVVFGSFILVGQIRQYLQQEGSYVV